MLILELSLLKNNCRTGSQKGGELFLFLQLVVY